MRPRTRNPSWEPWRSSRRPRRPLCARREPLQPQGNPPAAAFNRLHTYEEIADLLKGYAAAYPKWTRLESIGKSVQGRDLWMITITNPATGPELVQAGHVHRRQHPRQRGAGRRGRALHRRLPAQELRPAAAGDRDARPLGLLHPADGQPRRPRPLVQGPLRRRLPAHRHGAGGRRPRRQGGRGRLRRRRRRRLHHHHAQEGAAGPGHAPARPQGSAPAGARRSRASWATSSSSARRGTTTTATAASTRTPVGYVDPNRTWGFSWEPEYVQSGAGAYPLSIPETRVDRAVGARSIRTSPPCRATTTTAG